MPQKKPYLLIGLLWIETSYRCSYSSGKWWRLPSAPWLPSLHHLSISNHAYTLLCFLWPECFEASWGIKKNNFGTHPSSLHPPSSCLSTTRLQCKPTQLPWMLVVMHRSCTRPCWFQLWFCFAAICCLQSLCRDNSLCWFWQPSLKGEIYPHSLTWS